MSNGQHEIFTWPTTGTCILKGKINAELGWVWYQCHGLCWKASATANAIIGEQRPFCETIDLVQLHLKNFEGVSRLFEMIGQFHGCQIYDDYAHHPSEIRVVLQAARQKFPHKRILVISSLVHTGSSLKLQCPWRHCSMNIACTTFLWHWSWRMHLPLHLEMQMKWLPLRYVFEWCKLSFQVPNLEGH